LLRLQPIEVVVGKSILFSDENAALQIHHIIEKEGGQRVVALVKVEGVTVESYGFERIRAAPSDFVNGLPVNVRTRNWRRA
jgi:hypothetical protein